MVQEKGRSQTPTLGKRYLPANPEEEWQPRKKPNESTHKKEKKKRKGTDTARLTLSAITSSAPAQLQHRNSLHNRSQNPQQWCQREVVKIEAQRPQVKHDTSDGEKRDPKGRYGHGHGYRRYWQPLQHCKGGGGHVLIFALCCWHERRC